jgi:dynein intermediate chain, cytosolic
MESFKVMSQEDSKA